MDSGRIPERKGGAAHMRQDRGKKKQSFLHGAMILAAATVVVKLIGAFFKIPLSILIGGEGMGYFTTAYGLYNPIVALAVAGLPVAVSKVVAANAAARRYRDVRRIFFLSKLFLAAAGLVGVGIMLLGSGLFVDLSGNPGAWWSVIAISPALFFSCLMAAYRGYYEGLRNMYPTGASQVIEAVVKLVLGLGLSYAAILYGKDSYRNTGRVFGMYVAGETEANLLIVQLAAAAAVTGVMLSTCFGMLFLMVRHKFIGDGITKEELHHAPPPQRRGVLLRELISIAVPVCLGSLVTNLTSIVDLFSVMNRLGTAIAAAPKEILSMYEGMLPSNLDLEGLPNYLWGCYQGLAVTIFNVVPSVTVTFGISALPAVTTAWTRRNRRETQRNIESVLRITALVAFPAGLGLTALSGPILNLLFGARPQEVLVAAPLLRTMGIVVIFVAIASPVYSILQAIGRADLPVKFMLVGAGIKLAVNFFLVAVPQVNIQGAPVGTTGCYAFIVVASLISLKRLTKIALQVGNVFVKPFLCGGMCALAAWASYGLLARIAGARLSTVIAVALGGGIYLIALLATKTLQKDDILMLPKGEKIAKALEKRGFIG